MRQASRREGGREERGSQWGGETPLRALPGPRTSSPWLGRRGSRPVFVWWEARAIRNRRSDRKFQSKPVPEAALEAIVKAALRAPNARNQQKWHFTMIASQDLAAFVGQAQGPHAVFGRRVQLDCGAAVENAALAAESLGLASCVMAMPGRLFAADDAAELAKSLGIPEGYAHMISLAVGYREGERPAAPPRNKDVVTWVR